MINNKYILSLELDFNALTSGFPGTLDMIISNFQAIIVIRIHYFLNEIRLDSCYFWRFSIVSKNVFPTFLETKIK